VHIIEGLSLVGSFTHGQLYHTVALRHVCREGIDK
jgi:hypothetical protein